MNAKIRHRRRWRQQKAAAWRAVVRRSCPELATQAEPVRVRIRSGKVVQIWWHVTGDIPLPEREP
jgi:hypothetical protein